MIFLNPAVLFGLLAASIPVLIHLFNLRKLKKIDFSTLVFLKELQKNKIRKIKLKQWLLLALRVLIVLFLVTAFARPTLEGVAIGGTTSAAKTTAVFILDNSFSMSVIDGQGSYFNQAKEQIKNILKQMQEGDEAALILTSNLSKDEIHFINDMKEFNKKVNDAELSYTTSPLNKAVIKAALLIGNSKNFNKEIYILSDFQSHEKTRKEELSNLGELLNKNTRIYAFQFSGKESYNIGIDDIKLNTQIFEKNKPLNFSVTVTNYSKTNADNVVLSLFMNGERAAQQSVSLEAGSSKIISMEAASKQTGFVDIYAELEDDDILQDNKRYLNAFIPKETPLLILSENAGDSKFIELALRASDEGSSLKVTSGNINQLASFNLSQYQSIIIIPGSTIPNSERLKNFNSAGGGLVIFPSSTVNLSGFKNSLRSLNLPSPLQFSGAINSNSNIILFDKVEYGHPLFDNLFLKEDKKKIESPDIYAHYRLTTEGKGESVISLQDGSAFLSEYKNNKGRILLYNTSPVITWSSFPFKSIFVPLITKSVFYTASQSRNENSFQAGENAVVDLSGRNASQMKIIRPDKTEEFIQSSDIGSSAYLNYNKTDKAGNYHIYSGDKEIDVFSVNANPVESRNNYQSETEIKDYFKDINFGGKLTYISAKNDPSKIIMQSRFGSELWRYFVVLALILAVAEMIIARNSKKELATI